MADDDAGFLRAYGKFFAKVPDMNLVGVSDSGRGLVERLATLEPDVLLLDVEMPGPTGIEVARALHRLSLPTRIVMLTAFDREEYVHEALRYGASGFLLKNASPVQILSAIRAVHAGHASLALDVTSRLVEHFPASKDGDRTGPRGDHPAFTEQQINICRLLAAGYKSQDIAGELHLSNETVRTYVRRMFEKFGVKNRTQLVALAYKSGVLR
ncbi:DNA-binding NarL/FixJ family response regulator [Nocardiopsis mwathae]|uniref:DNA-binding NarL/FixJ family response regulator n=1 Tax=Nocardiopsis mwathae TaxID=1472723 RepID=A0A7X0D427_9ACTN|nr:response regulator transcription factor [Nocardiopsis mwathae]MBB6170630.1 DNA-binding NarL/FixJ family response regulator [Nocardiopsis mwathae]